LIKDLGPTSERFICAVCTQSQSAPGFCPEHTDEPLLDTHDTHVIAFLTRLDEKTLRKRLTRVAFAVALLISCGMLFVYFGLTYIVSFNSSSEYPLALFENKKLIIEIMVAGGLTAMGIVISIARKRVINAHQFSFDRWTDAGRLRPTEQEFRDAEAWRIDGQKDDD
jgi:hypothetical protein